MRRSKKALTTSVGRLISNKTEEVSIMEWAFEFFLKLMMGVCTIIWTIGIKLRLGVCLVYITAIYLFFWDWYCANKALAEGILIALLVLTAISWVITFVLKIKKWRMLKRADKVNRQYLETTK